MTPEGTCAWMPTCITQRRGPKHSIRVPSALGLTLRDVPRAGERTGDGRPRPHGSAHAWPMPPATTPPPPGSMTVPPLFGWEVIMVVLLLLVALAVTFFVLSATGRNKSERRELQAWLDARSYKGGQTDMSDASPTLSGRYRRADPRYDLDHPQQGPDDEGSPVTTVEPAKSARGGA